MFWGFPYNKIHYLTHPHKFFGDLFRNIKFGIQRFVRGWDDSASWSADSWMCDLMPQILLKIKQEGSGVPQSIYEIHSCNIEMSKEEWNDILDKIIAGFVCGKKIIEYEYNDEKEFAVLEAVWSTGMDLFKEHFFKLWD